jgi:hypothetical protein
MTLENLFAKVTENVSTLKPLLTNEEIAKLNHSELRPFTCDNCLFGQMTGGSDSDRAKEILPKEFRASYSIPALYSIFGTPTDFRVGFDSIQFKEIEEGQSPYFTALEIYLMLDTNSSELYEYLKGERETFEPRLN